MNMINEKFCLEKNFGFRADKLAVCRDYYAAAIGVDVFIVNIHTGGTIKLERFGSCADMAGGFDCFIALFANACMTLKPVEGQAPDYWYMHWDDGIAVSACEGHTAMLKSDGTVCCDDNSSPLYAEQAEKLNNIKQIALTFENFYALSNDGRMITGGDSFNITNFYNDGDKLAGFFNDGREILQIAAFNCYYSLTAIAALYSDGTVKALYDGSEIEEVKEWRNVRKICCGNHGAVFGLTRNLQVLLPKAYPYHDRDGNAVIKIDEPVADIAANFDHFIAVTFSGKIIYLHE